MVWVCLDGQGWSGRALGEEEEAEVEAEAEAEAEAEVEVEECIGMQYPVVPIVVLMFSSR
jgi:hypothetical protein